jgi:hypothetical protein
VNAADRVPPSPAAAPPDGRAAFLACAALALALHAALLATSGGLRGGADLLPHLRLAQQMAEAPALRSVYAPAYHALGALASPWIGLERYPAVFAFASALALLAAFRYFQRAAGLPGAVSCVFALWPYSLTTSFCLPKVESAGYALAFLALGLLARRRYALLALCLAACFWLHTASALFLGIAAGLFALARRDARALAALAVGTLGAAPLVAAHVRDGCTLAQSLMFSQDDYLRATRAWSSLPVLDRVLLLANPILLVLAGLGARELWARHREVAWTCAALFVLYLNELWLAPLETRTALDLVRGLSVLVLPASASAGVLLAARPPLARVLLAACGVYLAASALWVVPRSCHVRPIALAELADLSVERCTFRWSGPNIHRPARSDLPPAAPRAQ